MNFSFLFPTYNRLSSDFILNGSHFIHYTNAEGLKGILESQSFRLSNARDMNDTQEIEHGISILEESLFNNPIKNYIKRLINNLHPNLFDEVESELQEHYESLFSKTYFACFSTHRTTNTWERKYGRLSLWKEYSKNESIALVLNPKPFFINSSELNLFPSPVVYVDLGSNEFRPYIYELISSIEDNLHFIKNNDPKDIKKTLLLSLLFAVSSIKHPAFNEEREWRLIHLPKLMPSPYVTKVKNMDKMQVPLKEIPEINYHGVSPINLIKKIIIGPPSANCGKTYEKIQQPLLKAGFKNLNQIITFSNIPFRDN